MLFTSSLFPKYSSYRSRFIEYSKRACLNLRQARVIGKSPDAEDLFQDYAYQNNGTETVYILLSGVHGAEGYIGSDSIIEILKLITDKKVHSKNDFCLVHAVNPYGMSWYRRTNKNNVDLNRNGSPNIPTPDDIIKDYQKFIPWLNSRSQAELWAKTPLALFYIAQLGLNRANQAVCNGQDQFSNSLFFSGTELQQETKLLAQNLKEIFPKAKKWILLDVHSGLGPFANEALIPDTEGKSKEREYFEKAFNTRVINAEEVKGFYRVQGILSMHLRNTLGGELFHLTQEFGTRHPMQVLTTLIEENWTHQETLETGALNMSVANKMLSCFYPEEKNWRERCTKAVVKRWSQLVEQN